MEFKTALDVFKLLEKERNTQYQGDPPVYDARLDAATANDGFDIETGVEVAARFYRVRVTAAKGSGGTMTPDELKYITEVAEEHEISTLELSNNGVELF